MLTPDQIRLRLVDIDQRRRGADAHAALSSLIDLLRDVLPDLVAATQTAHGPDSQMRDCPDCTPNHPCDRVRRLGGEG